MLLGSFRNLNLEVQLDVENGITIEPHARSTQRCVSETHFLPCVIVGEAFRLHEVKYSARLTRLLVLMEAAGTRRINVSDRQNVDLQGAPCVYTTTLTDPVAGCTPHSLTRPIMGLEAAPTCTFSVGERKTPLKDPQPCCYG